MTTENRCGECGKAVAPGDRFCAHCGALTTGARGEAAPSAPPPRRSPWDAILDRLQRAVAPKYRVKRVLGYGGMAGVYLAEEPKLGRRVAIKVMSPALMVDPKLVERFEQEARTIAQLNHPHIVTIYEVDERDDLHYFTMTKRRRCRARARPRRK
jgi:serine/threonine-protein kinase